MENFVRLQHINDLAMTIDLEKTLCLAEAIYQQLNGADELPTSIKKIIGLVPDGPEIVPPSRSGSMDLKVGQQTPDRQTPSPVKPAEASDVYII